MNQRLLIASTLVIAATFAISFAAVMDNQASAQTQRPDGNVAQDARNELRQGSNAQQGLVNLGNTAAQANIQANLEANCAVNVLAESRCN